MEYIIISIILVIALIVLVFVFDVTPKTLKEIKNLEFETELNNITDKFPSNIEVCKQILKKLNNEKVKVEEDKDSNTSLYIAISDKISIANVKNNFTRIQTIAHECLHSIQNRKILLFNFWFSNIYLLFFVIILVLLALNKLPQKMMFIMILTVFGIIYYFVRSYLEYDAMIKARYLAKDYMEEQNIISKEEVNKIVDKYDYLNTMGVKLMNYKLLFNVIVKTLTIALISMVR